MEDIQYDVFISYSRKDYVDETGHIIPGNAVSEIKELLKKNNISYWFDEEGIRPIDDFAEKITTNMEKSLIVLFLASHNANESKDISWTSKEISTAIHLKKHILSVRLDDSTYNKSVMYYISDLNFVEYYKNKEVAQKRILESIQKKRTEYEAIKRKEKEEELYKKIKADITTLVGQHTIIRREINTITDTTLQERLLSLLEQSDSSYQELQQLRRQFEAKEQQIALLEQTKRELEQARDTYKEKFDEATKQLSKANSDLDEAQRKQKIAEERANKAEQEIRTTIPNAEECFRKGKKFYDDGKYEEAVKWYRKAAEQGNVDAQDRLGFCYEYGKGVSQNYTEAVKWYVKAAEQRNANAQNDLRN